MRKFSQEYFDMLIHECGIGARILEDTPTGTLYKKLHEALIHLTTPTNWSTEDGEDADESFEQLAEDIFSMQLKDKIVLELFPWKQLDSRLIEVSVNPVDGLPQCRDVTNETKN